MVTPSGLGLLFLLLTAGGAETPSMTLRFWAIEAAQEGRETPFFDEAARETRDALADLKFDTFNTLLRERLVLEAGQERRLVVSETYTTVLRCLECPPNARARLEVTVLMPQKEPDAPPRKVVETTLLLSPQGKARVGGLRTSKGEIVLVLAQQ